MGALACGCQAGRLPPGTGLHAAGACTWACALQYQQDAPPVRDARVQLLYCSHYTTVRRVLMQAPRARSGQPRSTCQTACLTWSGAVGSSGQPMTRWAGAGRGDARPSATRYRYPRPPHAKRTQHRIAKCGHIVRTPHPPCNNTHCIVWVDVSRAHVLQRPACNRHVTENTHARQLVAALPARLGRQAGTDR